MKRITERIALLSTITAFACAITVTADITRSAAAQAATPGDLVVAADLTGGAGGRLYTCPNTIPGPVCNPTPLGAPLFPRMSPNGYPGFKEVINGIDNASCLAIWDSHTDYLVRYDAAGYTTLATLDTTSGWYTHYDMVVDDQDGSVLIARGSNGADALLRYAPTSGTLSTVTSFATRCWAVTIDDDSNSVFAATASGLLLVDRATGRQTTMCNRACRDIDHDQGTGYFVAVDGQHLLILDSMWNVVRSTAVRAATDVHVDDENGDIYVASTPLRTIGRYDRNCRTVWSCSAPGLAITGLTVHGQRKLTGRYDATARVYHVSGHFPQSPARHYSGALSIGLRPSIKGGRRALHLNWTCPLFALTASRMLDGVALFGFDGQTDASGAFNGRVVVPAGTPKGLRIHVGFWVTNRTAFPKAGVDVGECIVFTTD